MEIRISILTAIIVLLILVIVTYLLTKWAIVRTLKKIDHFENTFSSFKNKFNWILENVNDIFFELSPEGNIIRLSPSFEKITQFKIEEVIGNNLLQYYQDSGYGAVLFSILKEKGQLINCEIKLVDRFQHTLDCGFTAIVIYKRKKPFKILGILHDLSEQKKTQQLILESEFRYKTLVELSPNPIFVIQNKRFVFANPATIELLKSKDFAHLQAIDPVRFISKNDRKNFIDYLKKIQSGIQKSPIELRITNSHIEEVFVLSHARIIVFEDKPAFLFVIQEITKIKHYEEELLRAKAKAEESDRLKSSFLANMSHEIRTPLNGIIGFASLLRKPGITTEKLDSYTQIIQSASHQLLALINDIIDISKIEAGQIIINNSEININLVMDEMFALYKSQAERKNIRFTLNKQLSDEDAYLISDDTKIKQILNNLLNNAIKFTEKGHIEFGYSVNFNAIEFKVADTGIGIPETYRSIVFERFRQVEAADNRRFGGTGLGLSITKALIEILGGKIKLETNDPQGSIFTIELPFKPSRRDSTEIDRFDLNRQSSPDWSGKTILIAEDEQTNFYFLEEIIEDTKATILYADNGLQAVELYNNHPEIDLVLLDIKMPEMNGFQVLQKIKQHNPNMPVIAQTAYAMSNEKLKVYDSGFNNYISKPIDRILFYKIINQYFKNTSHK